MSEPAILAIDQGTTSTRAIVFGAGGQPRGTAQRELPQIYPADGWVEHDPERIWQDTLAAMHDALANAGIAAKGIAAIGIANQRETTIVWHRESGRPIASLGLSSLQLAGVLLTSTTVPSGRSRTTTSITVSKMARNRASLADNSAVRSSTSVFRFSRNHPSETWTNSPRLAKAWFDSIRSPVTMATSGSKAR